MDGRRGKLSGGQSRSPVIQSMVCQIMMWTMIVIELMMVMIIMTVVITITLIIIRNNDK